MIPIGPTDATQDGPSTAQANVDFSVALPIPIAAPMPVLATTDGPSAWGPSISTAWRSHISPPLERPPRA